MQNGNLKSTENWKFVGLLALSGLTAFAIIVGSIYILF